MAHSRENDFEGSGVGRQKESHLPQTTRKHKTYVFFKSNSGQLTIINVTEVAVQTVILVVTVVKEMSAKTEVTEKKRIKL